jgi:hypothetical protein
MLIHLEKMAGLQGRILRPLSAKLLPPTLLEERGWVKREAFYSISGRGRKIQMALAKQLSIPHYPSPAGGCILTEPGYARRVNVLLQHRAKDQVTVSDLRLLRLGRHLWPNDHLHVIVGRNERENKALELFREGRWSLEPVSLMGPLVLAESIQSPEDLEVSARITARYSDRVDQSEIHIAYQKGKERGHLQVMPIGEAEIERWRI